MPAVFGQLIEQGLIDESGMTANGKTVGENYRGAVIMDENVIRPFDRPAEASDAGFRVLKGNIFHSAVMKMSVVSRGVPRALPVEPRPSRTTSRGRPWSSTGRRTTTTASTIRRSPSTRTPCSSCAAPARRAIPGAAEVVNMRAPDYLLKKGITALACVGDGRQSGTSGSPSILNASPEAARRAAGWR